MKKLLVIVGAVVLSVLLIGGIVFAITAYRGIRLDSESKEFVDRVVPVIVESWDADRIWEHASPEFIHATSRKKLAELFKWFAGKLGNLKEYKGCEGSSRQTLGTKDSGITAKYIAKADFERGDAKIEVFLIKHDDKWQVKGFKVVMEAARPGDLLPSGQAIK